jgi:hypothetical protein
VDVRRLKEALWQRIKQLGKAQRAVPVEEASPPGQTTLRFQVQHLNMTAAALRPIPLHHTFT